MHAATAHPRRRLTALRPCRLALLLTALGLGPACTPTTTAPIPEVQVDGEVALDYTRALVEAASPRDSGTPGAGIAAEWIAEQCRTLGCDVRIDQWTDPSPAGDLVFRNVIATLPGHGNQFVVVGSHYDTKRLPTVQGFQGANDSGSSTGALLAMIRTLRTLDRGRGCELQFVFFDGEECIERYGPADGLHGSRRFVEVLHEQERIDACRALILLDMMGDRDLNITFPRDADRSLVQKAFTIAQRQGTRQHFSLLLRGTILDDHTPFARRGIPWINFIDFQYGPDNAYWHTAEDTMDKISAESLAIVSDVALQLVLETAHGEDPE